MKNLIFFMLPLCLLLCNCKKKNNSNGSDVAYPASLVGSWTNDIPSDKKPTFTRDSVQWNNEKPYAYILKNDTFYFYYSATVPADPEFIFQFSDNNTKLVITPFVGKNISTYTRK